MYRAIHVARDAFSSWLQPHESPTIDVVLVGHSMGGLLAADVALIVSLSESAGGPGPGVLIAPLSSADCQPNTKQCPAVRTDTGPPFRHRILGILALDAPFLGLHPGIIVSGIASLFRPAPSLSPPSPSPGLPSPTNTLPTATITPAPDPLFNPPFFKDAPLRGRDWLRNMNHFAHISTAPKTSSRLPPPTRSRTSILATAWPTTRPRALEDVDKLGRNAQGRDNAPVRLRFVN